MYSKIKEGYNLFIRKTENFDLVGNLTLKEGKDNYKDIDQLERSEMDFVKKYISIYESLSEIHALFISYDQKDHTFFVSIQEKSITGEYNDIVVWNHIIVSKKQELVDALNRLEEKVQTKCEVNFSK